MAQHTHDVYDTGKCFEINGLSRFIKETSSTKLVLVKGDHKSEVITFQLPRFIDGHDMLLCNKIRVHYINIETATNNKSADLYEVTDLKLCEECEDILTFTWTIDAEDLEDALTFNGGEELELPTLAAYNEFAAELADVAITLTVAQSGTTPVAQEAAQNG